MTIFSVIFSPCELPSLWPRPRSQFGRHCYQCWCYFVSASADCHNSDVAHSICLLGNSVARSGGIKWTWGMEHGAWSRRQGSGGTPLRQTRLPGLWLLAQLLLALFFFCHFVAILFCIYLALLSPFYAVTFQRWLRRRQNPFYLYAKYVNLRPARPAFPPHFSPLPPSPPCHRSQRVKGEETSCVLVFYAQHCILMGHNKIECVLVSICVCVCVFFLLVVCVLVFRFTSAISIEFISCAESPCPWCETKAREFTYASAYLCISVRNKMSWLSRLTII